MLDEEARRVVRLRSGVPGEACAAWGERFFHITDPDGHELSFAELLPVRA